MADVFLSYARQSRTVAAQIVPILQREGWRVWWDTAALLGGDEFRSTIETEIAHCKCVLVLWSRPASRSGFVLDEATRGSARGILVQAIVDDLTELPLGFGHLHWVNLSNDRLGTLPRDGVRSLVESVRRKVEQFAPSDASSAATSPSEPRSSARGQAPPRGSWRRPRTALAALVLASVGIAVGVARVARKEPDSAPPPAAIENSRVGVVPPTVVPIPPIEAPGTTPAVDAAAGVPTQAAISRVISDNKIGIKTCYQRALLRDGTLLHGKIVVGATILPSGHVDVVKIDASQKFQVIEPCVREMMARWLFPQASEKYGTEFSYVFQGNE